MITYPLRTLPFLLFTALLVSFTMLQPASAQSTDLNFRALDVTVLGSSTQIDMGQYAEIGKFRVSNRSGRNLTFDSLRLRNYGTADLTKSFENVQLTTTTGEVIADLASSSRKYWTWRFRDRVQLDRGDSLIVSVKARLIYAKRGQTVQFGIRRAEDLALTDNSSGFAMACGDCEGTRLKEYRLDTGGVYITRQPTYRASNYRGSRVRSATPYSTVTDQELRNTRVLRTNTYRPTTSRYIATPRGSQQYSPGSRDVVFFSSRTTSRTPIGVDGIFLNLGSGSFVSDKDGDGKNTTIDDIDEAFGSWRLLINGVSEDTTSSLDTYNGQTGVYFNGSFVLPNSAQIALVGRVKNQAQTGDKVRFGLSRSGLIDPEYLFSGNTVNNVNGDSRSNYSAVR